MVVRKLFEIDEEKGWGRVARIRCIKEALPLSPLLLSILPHAPDLTPLPRDPPLAIRKWRCNLRRVNSTGICGS